jgi:RNA polymerase sigma factor (sigma-70 family)
MAQEQLACVLRHVQRLVGGRLSTRLSDGELLERFTTQHDEAAFEVLVQRHGPLVLRVCRRVLHDAYDAEDAFQATFLVLARKAASIRSHTSVAGWLYGVAYHLAVRARARAAKRRLHERRAGSMRKVDSDTRPVGRELEAVLDEELGRLPEKYRTPLVLCYLEGKTNEQAACELGCPAGSMSSRLARARELLRDRLTGRGVALSAAGLACLLGSDVVSAGVPASLVKTTTQAALLFAAGKSGAAGAVSAGAVALAEGVVNAMITCNLKLLTALVLTLILLGTGAGVLIQQKGLAQAPAYKVDAQAATPMDDQPGPGKDKARGDLYGDPLPPQALARMGSLRWRHDGVFFVSFLPDGKSLLTAGSNGTVRIWDEKGQEVRRFGKPPEPAKNPGMAGVLEFTERGFVRVGSPALPGGGYTGAALSADGKTLALMSLGASAVLWDVATGTAKAPCKAQQPVPPFFVPRFLAFSPDGKNLLVQGGDQLVRVYETATGKEVRQIGPKQGVGMLPKRPPNLLPGSGVALSPDGKTLIMWARHMVNQQVASTLTIFETASGKELRQLPGPDNGFMGNMAVSEGGKSLVWWKFDGTIRFWDLEKGVETRQLAEPNRGNFLACLRFSPDGKTLAAQGGRAVQLWDVKAGKEVRQFGDQPPQDNGFAARRILDAGGRASTVAFSRDGKKLVAAFEGSTLRQWDVATGKETQPARGHRGAVLSALLSEDGKTVTTLGADSTVRQWEAATGKELFKLQLPVGSSAALSANGRVAAAVDTTGAIRVWEVSANKEVRTIEVKQETPFWFGGDSLTLSPDGKILAVRNLYNMVRVWDVATGKELRQTGEQPNNGGLTARPIGGFGRNTQDLVFSPDGQTLAFLSFDTPKGMAEPNVVGGGGGGQQTLRLSDVKAGKLLRTFAMVPDSAFALAFSPDGKTLASRGRSNITLWETATGKVRFQFKGAASVQFGFSSLLSFSPDGKTLAAPDQARALRLWDVATGKELGNLTGHQGGVESVAFAPDGKKLVSGSSDTTALTWDVAGLRKPMPLQPVKLTDKELSRLWDDLISDDAGKAYRAIRTLRATPKQAVALLGDHLKPAVGVEKERITKLIAALDSDIVKVRQKAASDLEKLGELARPALTEALKKNPPLETRQRLEKLLEKLPVPAIKGELLRAWRALEVLEQVDTQKARQVLAALAKGAPGAPLTVEAQRILDRLTQHSVAQP